MSQRLIRQGQVLVYTYQIIYPNEGQNKSTIYIRQEENANPGIIRENQ